MITPELLEYVRTEIAKGRTREEIHRALISSGGWDETDLSEAFRIVIPMQNVMPNIILPKEKLIEPAVSPLLSPTSPSSVSFSPAPLQPSSSPVFYSPSLSLLKPTPSSLPLPSASSFFSSLLKFLIVLIIIGGLGFGAWYYRSQIINLWDSLINKSSESSIPTLDTTQNTNLNNQANNQAIAPTTDVPSTPALVPVPPPPVPSSIPGVSPVSAPTSIQINSSNNTGIFGNKDDLISFSVLPGQKVSGVMNFIGSIKNSYFFEGNVVINILDVNQKLLLGGHGTATTKWTITGPVSFTAIVDFTLIPKGLVYIQIKNDNPSGLPKNDKIILIPVMIE